MVADNEIPTRNNCNIDDPEERFLWMLIDLPDQAGASLILPVPALRKISARLSDAGAQLACEACGHEKEPAVVWRPIPGHSPMLGSAGHWVDADTPDVGSDAVGDVLDQLKPEVHKALIAELAKKYPTDETLQKMAGETQ